MDNFTSTDAMHLEDAALEAFLQLLTVVTNFYFFHSLDTCLTNLCYPSPSNSFRLSMRCHIPSPSNMFQPLAQPLLFTCRLLLDTRLRQRSIYYRYINQQLGKLFLQFALCLVYQSIYCFYLFTLDCLRPLELRLLTISTDCSKSNNSLVAWIAKEIKGIKYLGNYIGNSSGCAFADDIDYYTPYDNSQQIYDNSFSTEHDLLHPPVPIEDHQPACIHPHYIDHHTSPQYE